MPGDKPIHESPPAGRPKAWHVLLFVVLALAALALRAFGLENTGVGGNDTILYYTLAERWSAGNPVYRIGDSIQVFRPALLAFNAAALNIFGHTDYAIKLANVIVDSYNVLLVGLLAWLLSGRVLVSFGSALTYAGLPLAIWAARSELPHTLSTFFVLLALVFSLAALRSVRHAHWGSAFAGLWLALAALTHEELILIAVPIGLFLLYPRPKNQPGALRAGIVRFGLFVLAPACASMLILARQDAALASLAKPAVAEQNQDVYLETLARFAWNGLSGAGSMVFLVLLGLGLSLFFWKCIRGSTAGDRHYLRSYLFCMGIYLAFLALYAFFLDTVFVRALLPLIPLVIIAVFFSLVTVLEPSGKVVSHLVVVLVSAGLTLGNVGAYSALKVSNRQFSDHWDVPVLPDVDSWKHGYYGFLHDAAYLPSYYTYWGTVHDVLSGRVDAQNRVLLLPSTAIYAPGRRPLQVKAYFGDNVIYRLDHADLSLQELVRIYRVRYIVFSTGQLRQMPTVHSRYLYKGRWAEPAPVDLAREYGMEAYSEQQELYRVMRYVKAVGATELHLLSPGSFEANSTRIWELP